VASIELEDGLVVGDGLGRLVGDLFADQRHFIEQFDPPLGVGRALDGLGIEAFELAPLLGPGEDLLEARERALVARLPLQDPF
jgi:hypothetical protein